jgi:hypothetical protein
LQQGTKSNVCLGHWRRFLGLAVAPIEMQRALIIALRTGQRQGDILRLSWSSYDGETVTLKQGSDTTRKYIDARPPPPIRRNLLATRGRTIHWVNRVDFATSALASAVHNTGHYHVRLGPVCLAPSCTRIAFDRRNSVVLSSTGQET